MYKYDIIVCLTYFNHNQPINSRGPLHFFSSKKSGVESTWEIYRNEAMLLCKTCIPKKRNSSWKAIRWSGLSCSATHQLLIFLEPFCNGYWWQRVGSLFPVLFVEAEPSKGGIHLKTREQQSPTPVGLGGDWHSNKPIKLACWAPSLADR